MSGNLLYWTDNYNEPKRINVEAAIKMNHPTYSTSVTKYDAFSIKITSGGTGYVAGTYNDVPLTGGTGTGAKATIVVAAGVVTSVSVSYHGTGYVAGDSLGASNTNLGGSGSGLAILITKLFDNKILTLARPQPWAPITPTKAIDTNFTNNFLQAEAFQFAYRFVYRDNEVSTFSPLSKLVDYNTAAENTSGYNAVTLSIPTTQWIEQDVKKIEFAVKYMTGGKMFVFKTLDNGFDAHNNGTAIQFKFYNDVIGVAVDDATSVKQFDSVPVKSNSLDIAKNRLFLANNTDGYDTPKTTSLDVASTEVSTTTVIGKWYVLTYSTAGGPVTKYLLLIENITGTTGYYEKNVAISTPPPYPTTATFSDYTWKGYSFDDIASSYLILVSDIISLVYTGSNATVTGATLAGLSGKVVFKSESSYKAGVVFYDYAGRKSGVVANDGTYFETPDRAYSGASFIEKASWSLSNLAPTSEIPTWATHYSVVRTRSLRTSFFSQQIADAVEYITKDATGAYQTPNTTYAADKFGVAVKVKSLFSIGFGYSFQEGDILKLYVSTGTTYRLRIKDTYSDYIITELANVGSGPTALYEIYTPYVQSETEYFYEVGETYKINNPGTVNRQYSIVSGFFTGDVSLFERTVGANTKFTENMSPSDKYWNNWYTDSGRANIQIDEGQAVKPVAIIYSNVVVPGTKINGLSSFDALDQTSIPTESGAISRLVFTSKSMSDGTVMLAVGQQETASIYLGETQLVDNTGSTFLAKSTGVIGNINLLKGSYGTINPESVFEWQGSVGFFDANKGCWVKYDVNGLTPISNNKMSKYFTKAGRDILDYINSPNAYNNVNPTLKLRVLGAVDPLHGEYLFSMPRMVLNPRNTSLSDVQINAIVTSPFTVTPPSVNTTINVIPDRVYKISTSGEVEVTYCGTKIWAGSPGANSVFVATESTTFTVESLNTVSCTITLTELLPNYYDVYDGTGGTWCYQPGIGRFTSKYSFRPEWMSIVGNRLATFKNGKLYIHTGSYNTFYGQVGDMLLAGCHNDGGNAIKVYNTVAIEGDRPDRMHFRTESPNVQSSDIYYDPFGDEFSTREGVTYSKILRDRLSPNVTGTYEEKSFTGDPVRGEVCKFTYHLYAPNTKKSFKFINIGFQPSRGQTV
jgi:hypothetical protein